MSVRIEPAAQADIDLARDHLARLNRTAAVAFDARLSRTLGLLDGQPLIGTEYEPPSRRYPGLRLFPIQRYTNYLVYYQPTPDGITVVRVLHAARDATAVFG